MPTQASASRIYIRLVEKFDVFSVAAYERKPLRWMAFDEGDGDAR